MKRRLKVAFVIVGAVLAAPLVAIVGYLGVDSYQFSHASRAARQIPEARLERFISEAARLKGEGNVPDRRLVASATPFSDLPVRYVIVYRDRVDLVFYKNFEDEVAIQIDVSDRAVRLTFPSGAAWKTELLWQKKPNQPPEPTVMSVTPPAAQESRQP